MGALLPNLRMSEQIHHADSLTCTPSPGDARLYRKWRIVAGLPVEFCAHLPFATAVAGTGHRTKRAAVKIAVGILELRMIRDIEKFKAQLKRERFLNDCPLRDAKIGDVDSGTVEELAVGIAKRSEWARCECIREEVGVRTIGSRLPGILSLEGPDQVRNIREGTTRQGLIVAFADGNWEPR